MKNDRRLRISLPVFIFFCAINSHSFGQSFFDITGPLGSNNITPDGISGDTVVGNYFEGNNTQQAFVYDGSNFTSFSYPGGGQTLITGISGNIIFGFHGGGSSFTGFTYDGTNFASVAIPLGTNATVSGISGNNVVGGYYNNGPHGYLYNGSTYVTVDDPHAVVNQYGGGGSVIEGVDGNTVVGTYDDAQGDKHGFIYNALTSAYTTFDDPLATAGPIGTEITGISGGNIVGLYQGSTGAVHGFLFNGTTYTTIDDPAGIIGGDTELGGIDGDTAVGFYADASGIYHGFETTLAVPEPSALALAFLCAGLFTLLRYRTTSGGQRKNLV